MPQRMALGADDPRAIGAYRLNSRLGEGGQGVVYLANSPSGALVVVKVLRSAALRDPAARAHLAREVSAARTVARFCTAAVIEAEVDGDWPFIVSEYVEGPTLAEQVRYQGPLGGSALDRLAIGTATALVAIHQARIVHRDFKPNNVILGPDGPRVIDFGIAQPVGEHLPSSSPPLGTPAFTAPEQITSGSVGPAADLFAWASTMVFAATGFSPFQAVTPTAQLQQVMEAEPDLTGLPQPLASVLARCLAKDPALRPTAEQVLLDLLGGGAAGSGGATLAHATSVATSGSGGWAAGPRPGRRASAGSSTALLTSGWTQDRGRSGETLTVPLFTEASARERSLSSGAPGAEQPDVDVPGGGSPEPVGRLRGALPRAAAALLVLLAVGAFVRWETDRSATPGAAPVTPSAAAASPGAVAAGMPTASGAASAGSAGGVAVPVDFAGTWVGRITQPPGSGHTLPTTLTLVAGTSSGTFVLPSLGCTATVSVAAGGQQQEELTLDERVVSDPQHKCAAAARITLTSAGTNRLSFFWQDDAIRTNQATATLHRT